MRVSPHTRKEPRGPFRAVPALCSVFADRSVRLRPWPRDPGEDGSALALAPSSARSPRTRVRQSLRNRRASAAPSRRAAPLASRYGAHRPRERPGPGSPLRTRCVLSLRRARGRGFVGRLTAARWCVAGLPRRRQPGARAPRRRCDTRLPAPPAACAGRQRGHLLYSSRRARGDGRRRRGAGAAAGPPPPWLLKCNVRSASPVNERPGRSKRRGSRR